MGCLTRCVVLPSFDASVFFKDFSDMAQWDDYAGDEWMRPSSARETQVKVDVGRATRGVAKRPRLEKSPWKTGDHLSGFELLQQIGFGSHGWVFEAREIASGKIVALKLFPTTDPKEAVRAKTGFRRMSKLRHRGLVRLHRIHHEDDLLAFSMERIEGDNLVQVLRRWRSLPLSVSCEHLLEMLRQVGAALAWTHAHQLVHRDIKPTNLMMTADGNRFVIVDCDLTGEFEAESDPENIRGYLIWTPMYVAPEVLFRQSYCPASDIFSLGMVALEAMRIFSSAQRRRDDEAAESHDGDRPDVVIERDERSSETDRNHIVSALGRLHPDIPEVLVEIVNEMLSPDVSDRPTAMSLARLDQQSVAASPLTVHNHASARTHRITEASRVRERIEFRRWCHLVLGGQVQRLHLEGASGIGKSTFLHWALEELQSQSWPLVFSARCQRFEQRPLLAFSQIVDEIVMRYRRGGLGKLKIDSVSESILQRALPGFEEALEVDWSEQPIMTSPTRPAGMEAAMKVCNQLRQTGPLFFVIDDVQWADQDTIQILDHLQSVGNHRFGPPLYQGFGLITISRSDGDRQHVPPDWRITLGPLSRDIIVDAIRNEAELHGLNLAPSQLDAMQAQIEGQPYRLDAYLSELSPSGMLHDCLSAAAQEVGSEAALADDSSVADCGAPSIEEVWKHRSDQLQPSVVALLHFIVIAGRQMTFDELSCVEPNAILLETRLDELVENRLVVRDGPDGQYVKVWHDRLREQLLTGIAASQQQELHRQWALILANVPLSAGRIAEHYQKAGDLDQFVPWARQAAAEAQQVYAHIEAARWHLAVAAGTQGSERAESLRWAAEGMQRGGRMFEAAGIFRELSESLSGQARTDAELDEVQCFIRSGRFAEAVEHLDPLLARLHLPRRKPVWLSKMALMWHLTQQRLFRPVTDLRETQTPPERSTLQASQIAACRALVRPLSMIHNWLSAELNVFNRGLVRRLGARDEQIEETIGTSVFHSYQPGRKRVEAAASLAMLQSRLTENDSPAIFGDVSGGLAWSACMSSRWVDAAAHAKRSREFYSRSELHHVFEIAHTSSGEAIAYVQLGQLTCLAEMVDDMQAEALACNDNFMLAMGSLGYSSVAFLIRDDIDTLQKNYGRFESTMATTGGDGFAFFAGIEGLLRAIYLGRPSETFAAIARAEQQCKRSVMYRVEVMRMLFDELIATSHLAMLNESMHRDLRGFKKLMTSLRTYQLDSAIMKADLIEGVARARYPELFDRDRDRSMRRAMKLLQRAASSAATQQMLPSALAARDELARLHGNAATGELDAYLGDHGVVDRTAFARLYGGGLG